MKHEGFTPGPWKVRKMRSHIAIESALVRVADVRAARGPGHDSEADAALLAAAPDLLAENETLRALLDQWLELDEIEIRPTGATESLAWATRAALAVEP